MSRHLAGEQSPAATSGDAQHEDGLAPAKAMRDSMGASESQRLGDGLPVAGPITSFPDEQDNQIADG